MKCKNCKYWGAMSGREFQRYYPAGLKTCGRVSRLSEETVSNYWLLGDPAEPRTFAIEKEHSTDLAFVQDAEDLIADLMTMPDFGCVQFEDKVQPDLAKHWISRFCEKWEPK